MLDGAVLRSRPQPLDSGSELADTLKPPECQGDVDLVIHVADASRSFARPLPAAGRVTIGRGGDVDLALENPMVSRRHAVLHVGAEVEIEDLGSANGTVVAGARLLPGVRGVLRPGDAVFVGPVVLVLERRVRAYQLPAEVTPECLLDGITALAGPEQGIAVIRLDLGEELDAGWLRAAVSGLAVPFARLSRIGARSWCLLLPCADAGLATAALKAVTKWLSRWAVQASGEIAFLAAPVDEATLREQPLLRLAVSSAAGNRDRVVRDPKMRELFALAARVAVSPVSVLVLGETGTGKEVVAAAIHELSSRAERPFLRLNCATLNETLLESELFGHEAGAFTGAKGAKPGLLEVAHGGTVFLDEVAELPAAVQAKLLRVVENRQMTRVGGVKVLSVDVRFVAASNRDLLAEVKQRRFREDLYYRLAGFTLRVPPLRERSLDFEPLVELFLAQAPRRTGASGLRLSVEARDCLLRHHWPGNVRELKNLMLRAALLCDGELVRPEHLVFDQPVSSSSESRESAPTASASDLGDFPFANPEQARSRIAEALAAHAGNQTRAAKMLGISRRSLVRLLGDLDFQRPRKTQFL